MGRGGGVVTNPRCAQMAAQQVIYTTLKLIAHITPDAISIHFSCVYLLIMNTQNDNLLWFNAY